MLLRTPNCRPVVQSSGSSHLMNGRPTKNQVAVWIYPTLEEMGAATMLQGMRSTLGAAGYEMVISCPDSDELAHAQRAEAGFLRSLHESTRIAGAIVWETGSKDLASAYQDLVSANIPLVFIDREPPEPILADVVAANHRKAARTAVRYLIELGHRKIAMIRNEERVSSVEDRVDGYCSALREAGIPMRQEYIFSVERSSGEATVRGAERAASTLLSLADRPTAVFAVNDQVAMFFQDAVTRLGLRIPEDISLVGFDWLLRWLPSGGALTSISQPFETIGRVAAERLLERISRRAPEVPRQILLDAPLVVRGSTAPPPRRI